MAAVGTEMCSVHGKNRSLSSLVTDGLGGFRCSPHAECKIGTAATVGGAICSVHNKSRSLDSLTEDGWGGVRCIPSRECKVVGLQAAADDYDPEGWSTWVGVVAAMAKGLSEAGRKGSLGKGTGKGIALNAANLYLTASGKAEAWESWPAPAVKIPTKGGLGKGRALAAAAAGPTSTDGLICAVHGKQRSISALTITAEGLYMCKPGMECKGGGGGGVKKYMCKYFEQGLCQKGALCTFAHNPEEIGLPYLGPGESFDALTAAGTGARFSPY